MNSIQKELDEKLRLGENVSSLHTLFLCYFNDIRTKTSEEVLEKPRKIRFCGMDLKGVLNFTIGVLQDEQRSLNLVEAYFHDNKNEALLKSYELVKTLV